MTHTQDKLDKCMHYTANGLVWTLMLGSQIAYAQSAGIGGAFSGVTEIFRSIANLLIFEWGYYIGIISLAIQGYRWKTGKIGLNELLTWAFGIVLVFFAPAIVTEIKSRSSGVV
jgi:type IV secretion system protein VirB2